MSFRQYRDIECGEIIVVGADTAIGCGDYCAAQFVSKTKLDVPIVFHSPAIASDMTTAIYPMLEKIFDITGTKPLVAYERANSGATEMERLAALNRLGKYEIFQMPAVGVVDSAESNKLGWDTNSATRPAMLENLKRHIDNRLLKIYDLATINEFSSFIVVQTSTARRAQAEKAAHDDLVMSLAIALKLMEYATEAKLGRVVDTYVAPTWHTRRRAY